MKRPFALRATVKEDQLAHKRMAPGRFIALGFAMVILLGALLLMLPVSVQEGQKVSLINALFTSTSAVCVTGLVVVDPGDTLTPFGQAVLALLIQIGGLGVTSVGVGFIILTGKKIGMRERQLAKEGMNYGTFRGVLAMVKSVLLMTLCFEAAGTLLSFLSFSRYFEPGKALWVSLFHTVAAFNNAGFDILGNMTNLIPYRQDVLLNLTTCGLIIFGGLGFFVIKDILHTRSPRRYALHTKVVLITTAALLLAGTLLLRLTDGMDWLTAFFHSTSARTAGFSTVVMGNVSGAGLFVLIVLMFIGASPGSTGGGIKTSTFFVLIKAAYGAATNKGCTAFKRKLPRDVLDSAFLLVFLASVAVATATLALCLAEPKTGFEEILFEVVSAFGTVGLSTGITPDLSVCSKLVLILTMFTGRLGPLTIASLWYFRPASDVSYAEEGVTIG